MSEFWLCWLVGLSISQTLPYVKTSAITQLWHCHTPTLDMDKTKYGPSTHHWNGQSYRWSTHPALMRTKLLMVYPPTLDMRIPTHPPMCDMDKSTNVPLTQPWNWHSNWWPTQPPLICTQLLMAMVYSLLVIIPWADVNTSWLNGDP